MLPLQRVRQATAAVTPLMYWSGWCYAMDSATGEWKVLGRFSNRFLWLDHNGGHPHASHFKSMT